MSSQHPPHTLVIGGGFAGAAAVSALAEAGYPATLLEARATLGGRTSTLRDGVTRDEHDNGPHLFLGSYRETRAFLRRLKVEDRLKFQKHLRVPFVAPQGKESVLNVRAFPAGLGWLAGILFYTGLSPADRFRLLWGLMRWHFSGKIDLSQMTATEWLNHLGQREALRRNFWVPLCLAALNARPEDACAKALDAALREGFMKSRFEQVLGHALVTFGKLWPVELANYLRRQGGVVSPRQRVREIAVEGRRVKELILESGERVGADAFICAVSLAEFLKICPAELKSHYAPLEDARHNAILTVNLWLDKPVTNEPFFGLLDGAFHWVFQRGLLWEGLGAAPGALSLLMSDAGYLSSKTSDELIELAVKDLRQAFPDFNSQPRHATVVWEKHATPRLSPALWRNRPPVKTPLENFFLAGDWVETGLPCTIEAACRSGHAAAESVLAHFKRGDAPPAFGPERQGVREALPC